MLDLGRGGMTFGDFFVYADHADPLQFYFMPNDPHISKVKVTLDDGTEQTLPAVSLTVFKENLDELEEGEEDAVGILAMDVDLSYPADQIEALKERIEDELELDETPRVVPITFRSGSVRFVLLDKQDPEADDDDADEAPESKFVSSMLGFGQPSLYGDNRAIFQAVVNKKGAAILLGSLDGFAPVGVIYELVYAGLQPAFNIKVEADWNKVHDHFSEKTEVDALFYTKEIEDITDELFESQAIKFVSTVEGVGIEGMNEERMQVEQEIRAMLLNTFFTGEVEPIDPAGGGTAGDVRDIARAILAPIRFGKHYKRKEVKRETTKTLDIDWTVRRAAERTIYPQAHMHHMLEQHGVTKDVFLRVVSGADDMWKTAALDISTTASWQDDGISAVTVDVEYGFDPEGVEEPVATISSHLTEEKPREQRRQWFDPERGESIRYRYRVIFREDDVPGPHPEVFSDWIEQEGTVVVAHPRQLFLSRGIEVSSVAGFPFEKFPMVQALFKYQALDGSFDHRADGLINAETPKWLTRFRAGRSVEATSEIRLKYHRPGGPPLDTGWIPFEEDHYVVTNPEHPEMVISALVAGDRSKVLNLLLDLKYEDPEHGIHASGQLVFDTENINTTQRWTVHLVDPTRRRYHYKVTLVTSDGNILATDWIGSDVPTLPVGEVFLKRLYSEVSVDGDLGSSVEKIRVKLDYSAGEVHHEKEFEISGPDQAVEWTVMIEDVSQRAYSYTATWVMEDGFDHTIGPIETTETYLSLPGSPP